LVLRARGGGRKLEAKSGNRYMFQHGSGP